MRGGRGRTRRVVRGWTQGLRAADRRRGGLCRQNFALGRRVRHRLRQPRHPHGRDPAADRFGDEPDHG